MPRARRASAQPVPEPGSFRDPDTRVFYSGGGVYRALSERALADWEALAATRFFAAQVAEGRIAATETVPEGEVPDDVFADAAGLLRHEAIPFVSYPYEWPFGMLKDAALLQLDLLAAALEEGMILKDASPYNVQWRGARPVFIDVGSFERLREGEPWVGYRQFCMQFLYPLLLQAYRNVAFQPLLRGRLEGITPGECRTFLSGFDLLRPGVLSHVALHARLDRRHTGRGGEVREGLRAAGFRRELIEANVRRLRRLVSRVDWEPRDSPWSGYTDRRPYSDADAGRKADFVREVVGARRRVLVWDLGCNDGTHSRIAAGNADYVVAVDSDPAVVERLYRELAAEGATSVLSLAMDLVDPSPGLGWRGRERKSLPERGRPDLTLCLALVHHLAIGGGVPVAELVDWLAGIGGPVVIEFPTREDPMVQLLLAAKRAGGHPDYERDTFERLLGGAFEIERSEELSSGTRVLYHAIPRQ